MKNVLIACPMRNREWILHQYLACIYSLDYPKENISLFFLLNDCTDNTREILKNWSKKHSGEYKSIVFEEINFFTPSDLGEAGMGRGGGYRRDSFSYKNLCALRNKILEIARKDPNVDYLFSVDSDILIDNDILNNLINCEKPVVSALVHNGKSGRDDTWNFLPLTGSRAISPKELSEVKLTGACCLISKEVFQNKDICYSQRPSGEDESFCKTARVNGFSLWVLPQEQLHIMNRR